MRLPSGFACSSPLFYAHAGSRRGLHPILPALAEKEQWIMCARRWPSARDRLDPRHWKNAADSQTAAERLWLSVDDDAFLVQTPYGPITMHNLIAHKGAGERGVIALASHYDTKLMEGKKFVGANDGGSSTGLLLELARVLADKKDPMDYWFLFLDGEEAFVEWSTFDSTYGSRHLAQRWKNQGMVPKVRALILLDMIGDKDLDIWYETNSTKRLMDLVWETAKKIGLNSILSQTRGSSKTTISLSLISGSLVLTSSISTTAHKIPIITLRLIHWTKSVLRVWKKWACLCLPCFRSYRNSGLRP